jgi:tripartite-type tricarboxylate transporter receptor subunit TctC
VIVPFPAGGVVDVMARALGQALSEKLGVGIAVVNRDGAAGVIGARAIVAARPDGYTLGFLPHGPIATQPHLLRDAGYTAASFQPICQVFAGYFMFVAGRDGPPTAREAIAAARAAPGQLAFGFGGVGTAPHLGMLGLQRAAGVTFNGVSFRGDPPLVTALLGGELPLAVLTVGQSTGLVGRTPILAALTAERLPDFPDVPTARELGWDVVESQFGGLVAPAGLPAPVLQRLEADCQAAANDPRMTQALRAARSALVLRDAAGFTAALAAESEAKRELISRAGIQIQ